MDPDGATFTSSGQTNRDISCLFPRMARACSSARPFSVYVDVYEWQTGSSAWTLLGARISRRIQVSRARVFQAMATW